MPGSSTTPGHSSACDDAFGHVAFRYTDSVGTRNKFSIAAQWLACTFPCRRFADILANACARLGADVVRYSFIVVDLHHLLLAGLPAHPCENAKTLDRDRTSYSFKAAFGAHTQAHSSLKPNPRISFSSRFDFLSFPKRRLRDVSYSAAVRG